MAGNSSDQKGEEKEKSASILCAKEASALLNAIIDKDFDKKDRNWQETVWDLALKLRDCARRQKIVDFTLNPESKKQ